MPDRPADPQARTVRFDPDRYRRRTAAGCFVCAFLAGDPGYHHETVYADDRHVAFLDRYPTMPGRVLVAPRAHLQHVVRDLDEDGYLALLRVVRAVALAIEAVLPSERTYLASLGSQQGNDHLHWHIAPLPPGVPPERQQYHALMVENGLIPWSDRDAADLAARIRSALAE